MPKQPGGISKFQRVSALKEVLDRWGRLNKQQIDQHVAATLGCSIEEIARALYRDLIELEDNRAVVAAHFTRDGQEINDYDPLIHKTSYCEWFNPKYGTTILGAGRLAEGGIDLISPARMCRSLNVSDGKGYPDELRLKLYFRINNFGVCISLDWEALPAKLILCRLSEEENTQEIEQAIRDLFGSRACCLRLPVPNISSFKGPERPGHLLIEIKERGRVILKDMNSRNGSFYSAISGKSADRLITDTVSRGDATYSDGIVAERQNLRTVELPHGEPVELTLPAIVMASQAFELILV